jgi:mannosyltransferase OCH1-like enzyme
MIEKNIFQSWHTKEVHPSVQEIIDRSKSLNPDYTYHLYTDEDMDTFVNEHYQGEIADCYNRLNIIVAKVDFWRYLVLYKYGGVYLDMDASIERPLDTLIKETDTAIISPEKNPVAYVQWALIFKKEHPILKRVIDIVVNNIKTNQHVNNILAMTGPYAYAQAINQIHRLLYRTVIPHSRITPETDHTFEKRGISYRIYGVDYNTYFCFKHKATDFLNANKKHWMDEQREKPILKPIEKSDE